MHKKKIKKMKHTRPAALLCTVPGRLIIKMHLLFFIEIMSVQYRISTFDIPLLIFDRYITLI